MDLPHTDEGDDEGDNVTQHVEAVCYQGHGVGEVAHDELHQHEACCHGQHTEDLGPSPTGGAAQDSRKLHPQSLLRPPAGEEFWKRKSEVASSVIDETGVFLLPPILGQQDLSARQTRLL